MVKKKNKVGRQAYEDELLRLQQGLVDLREWVRRPASAWW